MQRVRIEKPASGQCGIEAIQAWAAAYTIFAPDPSRAVETRCFRYAVFIAFWQPREAPVSFPALQVSPVEAVASPARPALDNPPPRAGGPLPCRRQRAAATAASVQD